MQSFTSKLRDSATCQQSAHLCVVLTLETDSCFFDAATVAVLVALTLSATVVSDVTEVAPTHVRGNARTERLAPLVADRATVANAENTQ